MLIHSRKCFGNTGVGEGGREGGEAEIGSGTRVGGGEGAGEHHTSPSFFLSKVVPAF